MSDLLWFDTVTVISHPMTGRMDKMSNRLREWGVFPDYVFARRPPDHFVMNNMRRNGIGEFACNLSHVKAIMTALANRADRPLFLEDDVKFQNMENLASALADLPADWTVLYLGGHPCDPVKQVGEHLYRVGRFSFAEAYAIRGHALGAFLRYWTDRIGQNNAMFDQILGEFARDTNGYAIHPCVTYQPDGFSFVANREDENKSICVESGWLNHGGG